MMLPSSSRPTDGARRFTMAVLVTNCTRGDTGATRVDERHPQSFGTRVRPWVDQGLTGVFAGATQRPERHACLAVADAVPKGPATNVNDKVAVVTGGASGIGLALCTRFAKEGAHVVLSDLEQKACNQEQSARALLDLEER